jgi:hypothetical protein
MDQGRETPVCTSSTYGLIDPNSFSRWRRQFFVEHGLGRYEEVTQYMPNIGCDVTRQAYVGFNFHGPMAITRERLSTFDGVAVGGRTAACAWGLGDLHPYPCRIYVRDR